MKSEDKDLYFQLQEIFDIAWDLQIEKQMPTELTQKILRYFPSIMQQFSYYSEREV